MTACPICGTKYNNPSQKHWTTCGQHDNQLVCMNHCITCEWIRTDADISTVWCKYMIGRKKENPQEDEIKKLEAQIRAKEKQVAQQYQRNNPKVAERISQEAVQLINQLRKLEQEANNAGK